MRPVCRLGLALLLVLSSDAVPHQPCHRMDPPQCTPKSFVRRLQSLVKSTVDLPWKFLNKIVTAVSHSGIFKPNGGRNHNQEDSGSGHEWPSVSIPLDATTLSTATSTVLTSTGRRPKAAQSTPNLGKVHTNNTSSSSSTHHNTGKPPKPASVIEGGASSKPKEASIPGLAPATGSVAASLSPPTTHVSPRSKALPRIWSLSCDNTNDKGLCIILTLVMCSLALLFMAAMLYVLALCYRSAVARRNRKACRQVFFRNSDASVTDSSVFDLGNQLLVYPQGDDTSAAKGGGKGKHPVRFWKRKLPDSQNFRDVATDSATTKSMIDGAKPDRKAHSPASAWHDASMPVKWTDSGAVEGSRLAGILKNVN